MESAEKPKLGFVIVLLTLGIVAVAWVYWPRDKTKLSPQELATQALSADNPIAQQRAAIELSRQGATTELTDVVRRATDKNTRASAVQALGDAEIFSTIPVLFEAMNDESPTVRGAAAAAITRMIGRDFHYDANASPRERAKIMQHMRKDYESIKGNPPPKFRDQKS